LNPLVGRLRVGNTVVSGSQIRALSAGQGGSLSERSDLVQLVGNRKIVRVGYAEANNYNY
jgi:hypothetical protein